MALNPRLVKRLGFLVKGEIIPSYKHLMEELRAVGCGFIALLLRLLNIDTPTYSV